MGKRKHEDGVEAESEPAEASLKLKKAKKKKSKHGHEGEHKATTVSAIDATTIPRHKKRKHKDDGDSLQTGLAKGNSGEMLEPKAKKQKTKDKKVKKADGQKANQILEQAPNANGQEAAAKKKQKDKKAKKDKKDTACQEPESSPPASDTAKRAKKSKKEKKTEADDMASQQSEQPSASPAETVIDTAWQKAEFESDERKQKFLRLLGAKKTGAGATTKKSTLSDFSANG